MVLFILVVSTYWAVLEQKKTTHSCNLFVVFRLSLNPVTKPGVGFGL